MAWLGEARKARKELVRLAPASFSAKGALVKGGGVTVRVLVVGGLTRLDQFYRDAPKGLEIEAIYMDCPSLEARAEAADALVLVASNVSHPAAAKVRNVAKRHGIPLESALGPSVSRVRASIASAFLAARSRIGPRSIRAAS